MSETGSPPEPPFLDELRGVLARGPALDPSALGALLRSLRERRLGYREALVLSRLLSGEDLPVARLGLPRRRIALLADVNVQHLVPILRMALLVHGIQGEVRAGDFGQLEQPILDPASWLHAFEPDVVAILGSTLTVRSEDEGHVARLAPDRLRLCDEIIERLGADVVVANWEPLPAHGGPGGSPPWLHVANGELARGLPERAFVLDLNAAAAEAGLDAWFDLRMWGMIRQSFHLEHTPALAGRLAGLIRATVDPPIKLVVTDLDDTLWGGVVAEVGPENLDLGANALGESFLQLQRFLRSFVARGGMLAVCSKNDPEVARAPFERRPEMLLRLEDFVDFRASFRPKALVLAEIVEAVNVGMDSVLFLDDSPHERAEVREKHPRVCVPEWPANGIVGVTAALARRPGLLRPRVTREDAERTRMVRAEALRRAARSSVSSVEDFLAGLGLRAHVVPIGEPNLDRVTQLVQKTNQFNLTTRRHGRSGIAALVRDPLAWGRALYLEDRHGSYGLTAVLIAVPRDPRTLEIDTWLLSCRVMGKTVEHALFLELLRHARGRGIERIRGVYVPTAKNAAVAALYRDLGFTLAGEESGVTTYVYDARGQATETRTFVEVVDGLPSREESTT